MSTYVSRELPREEALKILTLQDVAQRGLTDTWPAPRWIKVWRDGEPAPTMAWLNDAYAKWYDVDPRVYVGQNDAVIWPKEICDAFHALDLAAISEPGKIVTAVEPTPRGKVKSSIVRKFAFRVDNDGVNGWGVYGEICPLEVGICSMCEYRDGT